MSHYENEFAGLPFWEIGWVTIWTFVHNCNSVTVRSPKTRYCLLRLFKHYRGAFPGNNNISLTCCTFFSFFESLKYLGYSRRWSYVLFWLWCWQFYDTSQYLKLENKEMNIIEWIIGIDVLISKFSWKSIRCIIFLGSKWPFDECRYDLRNTASNTLLGK